MLVADDAKQAPSIRNDGHMAMGHQSVDDDPSGDRSGIPGNGTGRTAEAEQAARPVLAVAS